MNDGTKLILVPCFLGIFTDNVSEHFNLNDYNHITESVVNFNVVFDLVSRFCCIRGLKCSVHPY